MRCQSQNMKNILNRRVIAGALLSGGIAVAGLGLGSGTAKATAGPFTWCPGQSMDPPAGPNLSFGVQPKLMGIDRRAVDWNLVLVEGG
jgi:hypothetical protein